jgi:nucleoid DNA-binding protein
LIKSQIVEEVAKKANTTKKEAREVIDLFLDEVKKALSRGESKVVVSGFGTFRTTMVKEKKVTVPGSSQTVKVKAHRAARFSPGKDLKRAVR